MQEPSKNGARAELAAELLDAAPSWLRPLTIIILVLGPLESFLLVPGTFAERAGFAAASLASFGLGLVAIPLVLGCQYVMAIWFHAPLHARAADIFARVVFWFGPVVSVLGVILLPFDRTWESGLVFAPSGVGYAWGARWIYRWYHRRDECPGEE